MMACVDHEGVHQSVLHDSHLLPSGIRLGLVYVIHESVETEGREDSLDMFRSMIRPVGTCISLELCCDVGRFSQC